MVDTRASLVQYLAEPVAIEAGKPQEIELHFRTNKGFHINSHSPNSSELIPTTLTMQTVPGIKAGKVEYPAGTSYAFPFAPKNKLNVYTGDFVVKVRMTAEHAGNFTLNGSVRYQACDNMQCYPPQNLSVTVPITARPPSLYQ